LSFSVDETEKRREGKPFASGGEGGLSPPFLLEAMGEKKENPKSLQGEKGKKRVQAISSSISLSNMAREKEKKSTPGHFGRVDLLFYLSPKRGKGSGL